MASFALVAVACSSGYDVLSGNDAGSPSDDDAGQMGTTTKDASSSAPDAKTVTTDSGNGSDSGSRDAGPTDASKPCTADTGVDPQNCGKCGRVCNSAAGCVSGECQHVVFVTLPPGNTPAFGGIDGGDAICQAAAAGAGLHGPFLAWLGTTSTDPATRFVHGNREYVLPLGTVVALDWTDLVSGGLKHGIDVDPHGNNAMINHAWTNVNTNGGTYDPGNGTACESWTSTMNNGVVGNVGGAGGGWSSSTNSSCMSTGNGIYCFEQ
jgi:hypothetical protein